MQALWSRAAQAHGCTCRACLRPRNPRAIVRQTTTAVARPNITPTDLFAAAYCTTLMATAVVLDTVHRDRKHLSLDQQIEDTRAAIAWLRAERARLAADEDRPSSAAVTATEPPEGGIEEGAGTSRPGPINYDTLAWLSPRSGVPLDLFRAGKARLRYGRMMHERFLLRCTDSNVNAGTPLTAIMQSMLDDEGSGDFEQREPSNQVQFDKTSRVVSTLADRLLVSAHESDDSVRPGVHAFEKKSIEGPYHGLLMLKKDGYPNYEDPAADADRTRLERQRLDRANLQVMARWRPSERRYPVYKICYNLLISKVPPGIQNFNVLILRLALLREHKLAQVIVDCLLEESRLRPTQYTILCLLHHYRLKDDVEGFYNLLPRLFGRHREGILLRRRTIEEIETHPDLQEWAQKSDVVALGGLVVERPRRDTKFFEALILGMLKFHQVRHAAVAYVSSMHHRARINPVILLQIIRRCLFTLDRTAAWTVLRGLLENINKTADILLGPEAPKGMSEALGRLVDLCRWSHQPRQLEIAVTKHLGDGAVNLRTLQNRLRISALQRELRRVTKVVEGVERAIVEIAPLYESLVAALSTLQTLSGYRQYEKMIARRFSSMLEADYRERKLFPPDVRQLLAVQDENDRILSPLHDESAEGELDDDSLGQLGSAQQLGEEAAAAVVFPPPLEQRLEDGFLAVQDLERDLKTILLGPVPDTQDERVHTLYHELVQQPLQVILAARKAPPAGPASPPPEADDDEGADHSDLPPQEVHTQAAGFA